MTVRVTTRSRRIGLRSRGPADRGDGGPAAEAGVDSRGDSRASSVPAVAGEEDLLAADLWLETPPRPERTILARFEYAGRDHPIPLTDLAEESEPAA